MPRPLDKNLDNLDEAVVNQWNDLSSSFPKCTQVHKLRFSKRIETHQLFPFFLLDETNRESVVDGYNWPNKLME